MSDRFALITGRMCQIAFVIAAFWPAWVHAYPWPLAPTNQVHPVSGVIGEFRVPSKDQPNSNYHFHNGVDMPATEDTSIYAVQGGVVKGVGKISITVGPFRYVHSKNFAFEKNDPVLVGQRVADVGHYESGTHLHLIEFLDENVQFTVLNPLRSGALTPAAESQGAYDPATWPEVQSLALKKDSPDGTTGTFFASGVPVYGNVDVVARAKDHFPGGTTNAGIYRMTYQIKVPGGGIGLSLESFRFDIAPLNEVLFKYYQHTTGHLSDNSTFYFLPTNVEQSVTSEAPFWRTKHELFAATGHRNEI